MDDDVVKLWKIRSSFKIKDNITCVIYQRICICGNNYIDEIKRNATTRTDEHEQPNGKPELSKYFQDNLGHKFYWMILSRATLYRLKRKFLEACFIKQLT